MATKKSVAAMRAEVEPHQMREVPPRQDPRVTDRLLFGRVYWLYGVAPRESRLKNDVTDPPVGGWQHVLAFPGEKRWTLFCPITFTSHQVSVGSMEQDSFEGSPRPYTREWLASWITERWHAFATAGSQVDYDMAARVLRELGAEVPTVVPLAREEDDQRERGGKPAADRLLKPVKRSGKRGRVLEWFLDGGGPRSIREAMAEFEATRSSVLSYLFNLNKDHGVGYRLVGDTAEVELPPGCESPWDEQERTGQ